MSPKVSPEVSPSVSDLVSSAVGEPASSLIVNPGICSITRTVYKVTLPITLRSIHFCDSSIFR